MEFLEKLYIKELNSPDSDRVKLEQTKLSDGSNQLMISIDGNEFLPSSILSDDETSYTESLELWKEERKSQYIDKANQILCCYGNNNLFTKLKKAYKSNNLMPFIGAGMSITSNYSGWTSFLYKLCSESDILESDLSNYLQDGKYEEAAQVLYDDLDDVLFNEHLQNEYSHEREIIGAVNHIPFLFPATSIITTNFDNVIERIYNGSNLGFDNIKSGKYLEEAIRQISTGSRMLIKIHGDCNQIIDRVLTLSEYNAAYATGDVLERFFNRILFKSSLLFLGCSLINDRTIRTMQKIVKKEGASSLPSHFAFLEEIKDENQRKKRQRDLANAKIFPIWYPEGEHEESIEALFYRLKED